MSEPLPTRAFVKKVIDQAHNFPWSLQGLGMFRTYLSKEVRLHVWDMRFVEPMATTLHTHPWDFTSHVMSGAITDRVLEEVSWEGAHQYLRQCIVCGPAPEPGMDMRTGTPQAVLLTQMSARTYVTGEVYSLRRHQIHESIPKSGTVTMVERMFYEDTERAFVYHRPGRPFVSAEPRPATADEVARMREVALDRWEEP